MNALPKNWKALKAAAARAAALAELEQAALNLGSTPPRFSSRSRRGLISAAFNLVATQYQGAANDAAEAGNEDLRKVYQEVADQCFAAAKDLGGLRRRLS